MINDSRDDAGKDTTVSAALGTVQTSSGRAFTEIRVDEVEIRRRGCKLQLNPETMLLELPK